MFFPCYGSGGGNYTETQLYFDDDYSPTSQMGTTINLSESLTEFDIIVVRGGYIPVTSEYSKDTACRFMLVSEIEDLIENYPNKTWVCSFFQHGVYGISAVLRFPNANQIYISDIAQPGYQGTVARVVEVVGIKFS